MTPTTCTCTTSADREVEATCPACLDASWARFYRNPRNARALALRDALRRADVTPA